MAASGPVVPAPAAMPQEKPEQVSSDRARANFARPVGLATDDIRAFPDASAGFETALTNGIAERTEVFEYDSTVTGKRRTAVVYLPPKLLVRQKTSRALPAAWHWWQRIGVLADVGWVGTICFRPLLQGELL